MCIWGERSVARNWYGHGHKTSKRMVRTKTVAITPSFFCRCSRQLSDYVTSFATRCGSNTCIKNFGALVACLAFGAKAPRMNLVGHGARYGSTAVRYRLDDGRLLPWFRFRSLFSLHVYGPKSLATLLTENVHSCLCHG